MRKHLSFFWPGYVGFALLGILIFMVVSAGNAEQARVNACFDRGMVLVDTPAGKRCAHIHLLEKVR